MNQASNQRERTVPTELAAMATGVSEATIRKWASRGRLTRYGRPGRAEYSIRELTDLAAQKGERRMAARGERR